MKIPSMLTYDKGYSADYAPGYSNGTEILQQMLLVDTYEEFANAVRQNWQNQSSKYSTYQDYSPYTRLSGGFWMGSESSKPTVMVNIRQGYLANQIFNFYTIMASGVGISSAYYEFASTNIPTLYDTKALIFIIYYGLIMAW